MFAEPAHFNYWIVTHAQTFKAWESFWLLLLWFWRCLLLWCFCLYRALNWNLGECILLHHVALVLLSTLVAKNLKIFIVTNSIFTDVFLFWSVFPAPRTSPAALNNLIRRLHGKFRLELGWLGPILIERLVCVIVWGRRRFPHTQ